MTVEEVQLTEELNKLIDRIDDESEKFLSSQKAVKVIEKMYDDQLVKDFESFKLIAQERFIERMEQYVKFLSTLYEGEILKREVNEISKKLRMKDRSWLDLLTRICSEFLNRVNMTQYE